MNGWLIALSVVGGLNAVVIAYLLIGLLLRPSDWTIYCCDCGGALRPRWFLPFWTQRLRIYAHRAGAHRDAPPLYVNPALRQKQPS